MVMAGDSRAKVSHGGFEVLTVTSVLLERPSEHGDLLASDATRSDRPVTPGKLYSRVEEGLDDLSRESVLLVLILTSAKFQFCHSPSRQQLASTWRPRASGETRTGRPS
jgi:hypothetical protein